MELDMKGQKQLGSAVATASALVPWSHGLTSDGAGASVPGHLWEDMAASPLPCNPQPAGDRPWTAGLTLSHAPPAPAPWAVYFPWRPCQAVLPNLLEPLGALHLRTEPPPAVVLGSELPAPQARWALTTKPQALLPLSFWNELCQVDKTVKTAYGSTSGHCSCCLQRPTSKRKPLLVTWYPLPRRLVRQGQLWEAQQ